MNSNNPKIEQNLPEPECEALKHEDCDIILIIQKSDKGNSVVIVNKRDYTAKMNDVSNDASKFKKLNLKPGHDYNFLINQELRISKALRSIMNSGAMLKSTYDQLNPTGTQPSVLYGLAKVHKPLVNNIPKYQPILSALNYPT